MLEHNRWLAVQDKLIALPISKFEKRHSCWPRNFQAKDRRIKYVRLKSLFDLFLSLDVRIKRYKK